MLERGGCIFSCISAHDSHGCWSFSYHHRGTTNRWVDAAPALRSARPRRRATPPPSASPYAVRTIASTSRCEAEEGLASLVPPLSPFRPRPHLDAPRRRVPQNATRRALKHCGTHAARSPLENRQPTTSSASLRERANSGSNTSRSDMKYSPQQQQQQQKQRKSESSDAASVDATLSRTSASVAQEQRKSSSTSSSTRPAVCRSPSTGMFAWMRVFRLASMLHQVGC